MDYRYPRLVNKHSTRVIILKPGTIHDKLECRLVEVSLFGELRYEAFSYTWGDTRITPCILHCEQGTLLHITENLDIVLRRFRKVDQERNLWIDAICIDQSDDQDKNMQVPLMHDIYQNASCVLIWLGRASDSSDLVFDYLDHLSHADVASAHEEVVRYYRKESKWAENNGQWPDMKRYFPHNSEAHIALLRLFSRSWFRRIWCLQEAVVNLAVWVVCGDRRTSWQRLETLLWQVRRPAIMGLTSAISLEPSSADFSTNTLLSASLSAMYDVILLRCRRAGEVSNPGPEELLMLLSSPGRNREASDNRDRIFALQHLEYRQDPAVGMQAYMPLADYSRSIPEVYKSAAMAFLGRGHTTILASAGTGFQKIRGLPSWTPDLTFSNEPWTSVYDLSLDARASGGTVGDVRLGKIQDQDAAILGGVVFDVIDYASGVVPLPSKTWVQSAEFYKQLHSLEVDITVEASEYRSYPTGELVVAAFWRTLTGNFRYTDSRGPPSSFEELMDWQSKRHKDESSRHEWDSQINVNASDSDKKYIRAMRRMGVLAATGFCITKRGYFGLSSGIVSPGDLVCVVWGCKMPLVLARKEHLCVLRGPCSINGIMEGEFVEDLSCKTILSEAADRNAQPANFKHLPPEWEKVEPKLTLRLYRSKTYGSRRLFLKDPRTWLVRSIFDAPSDDWECVHTEMGEKFWRNSTLRLDGHKICSAGWTKTSSDFGPLYIHENSSSATFDHPDLHKHMPLENLPPDWEIVAPQRPFTYFQRRQQKSISFRDPRIVMDFDAPMDTDWHVDYDFQLQETYFGSRELKRSITYDPRVRAKTGVGPLPQGWSWRKVESDQVIFTNQTTGEETKDDPCLSTHPSPDFPGFVVL